jgi:hypothetical protein
MKVKCVSAAHNKYYHEGQKSATNFRVFSAQNIAENNKWHSRNLPI